MTKEKSINHFWFTIEPYVHVRATNKSALLYNTLDGVIIESNKNEVILLLKEILKKENCGVILLRKEIYEHKDVNDFIIELREKFMGDIIDITLSKGKPVQLLPFFNFLDTHELYKKHSFTSAKNPIENLSEISIHVSTLTNVTKLIPFLQTIQSTPSFNIIGNIGDVENYYKLLSFFNQHSSPKNILCSYTEVCSLQPSFENNFSYQISVRFPINMEEWNNSIQILINQTLPVEYIFEISSNEDYQRSEELVKEFQIEKYRLNPVYTGANIEFFKENVFLTKEDILSTLLNIKDIFFHQSMNIYDFGKINILPNGDAYANLNFPSLGNIFEQNLNEIVQKEVKEGESWFRIRNSPPCNDCVYQWLCPSPSNYEIVFRRPNLCHLQNEN